MASGSANNPVQYGKLRDLTPTTRPPPLRVIVTRAWEVHVCNADTLNFIIMDAEGNQMHGWIPRRLIPAFEPKICKNSIIIIRYFRVIEKRNKSCSPLTTQYNIVFTENTKVEHRQEYLRFKPQQFNFTEFDQLRLMISNKNFLRGTLFSSTCVARDSFMIGVDPRIPPANELRRKITAPSPGKPEKRLLTSNQPRTIKDIRTAIAKGTTGYNLCRASVQQVYEDESWKYSSCTTCREKVTLSGADYWCFRCNAKETNPDERFKLQIQLADKHGLLDVTVFSEAASELLDISLAEMNNLTKNDSSNPGEAAGEMLEIIMKDMNAINEKPQTGQDEVRAEISKIVGREYLFHIKIDDYNLKNPEKALIVSSISNVREPQQNRMRTALTVARHLSFSTPFVVAENLPTKISSATTAERSQNNTVTDTSTTQRTASPITTAATSSTSSQQ